MPMPIARTAADVRALLSFLIPSAADLVMARLGDRWRGAGIVSASGCAGDILFHATRCDGFIVSHVPEGGVTYVELADGPAGTLRVVEHTADAQGIACRVTVATHTDDGAAMADVRARAAIHGCDYSTTDPAHR